MKIHIPRKIFLPIISLLMIGFVVLDQAIKKTAVTQLFYSPFYFNGYFSLEIYKNYGIAFGFPVNEGIFYFIFILFLLWLASGKLLNFKEMKKKEILAVVLILSGALGNLIDRIRFGYIIDYINLNNFVIFNLADVFIASGIIILLGKFLPDTGKGKIKKNIYISLFVFFGVLIGFLIHSVIEIWYINLLLADYAKYSLGLNWPQWYIIHAVGTIILFIGGILFGFLQGKYWWKVLYEKEF